MKRQKNPVEKMQLNQREAAEALGYSVPTLKKIADLPFIKIGGSIRYPIEALREWQRRKMEFQKELQAIPQRLKEQTDRLNEQAGRLREQMEHDALSNRP